MIPGNPQSTIEFAFAFLRVFNKTTLSNNSTSCPTLPTASLFQPATTYGDLNFYSLQAVQHYSYPASSSGVQKPAYLLSTAPPPSFTYKVWRLRNVASWLAGSRSHRRDRRLRVLHASCRVSARFNHEQLVSEHGPGPHSSGRWLCQLLLGHPHYGLQATGTFNSPACAQSGLTPERMQPEGLRLLSATSGRSPGETAFAAGCSSIAVDGSQNIAVGFLASSSGMYESFAFTTKLGGATSFAPGQIALAGNCSALQAQAPPLEPARVTTSVPRRTRTWPASGWLARQRG